MRGFNPVWVSSSPSSSKLLFEGGARGVYVVWVVVSRVLGDPPDAVGGGAAGVDGGVGGADLPAFVGF